MLKFLSAKYYQENKDTLKKKLTKRCQNLSYKENKRRWQYGRECYKNLSKNLSILVEYRKK